MMRDGAGRPIFFDGAAAELGYIPVEGAAANVVTGVGSADAAVAVSAVGTRQQNAQATVSAVVAHSAVATRFVEGEATVDGVATVGASGSAAASVTRHGQADVAGVVAAQAESEVERNAQASAVAAVDTQAAGTVQVPGPAITPQLEAAMRYDGLAGPWKKPEPFHWPNSVWHAQGVAFARVTATGKGTSRKAIPVASARGAVIRTARVARRREPALVAVGAGFVQEEGREVALLLGIPEDFS